MPFPGITSSDVLTKLAEVFQLANGVADLPSSYSGIASDALSRAVADLGMIFGRMGYSQAQLSQWDSGAPYALSLSIYFALSDARVLRDYPDIDPKAYDPREWLQENGFISIGGTNTAPAPGSPIGGINAGDSTAAQCAESRYYARTHGRTRPQGWWNR